MAAFFAIQTFPNIPITGLQHAVGHHSSTYGLSTILSFIAHPELRIIVTSTFPVLLSMVRANFDVNAGGFKPRQDISPIPLLDLLYGAYCKSLDPFKPVGISNPQVKPASTLNRVDSSSSDISYEFAVSSFSLASYALELGLSGSQWADSYAELFLNNMPIIVEGDARPIFEATPFSESISLKIPSYNFDASVMPARTFKWSAQLIKLYACMACFCTLWLWIACDTVLVSLLCISF